MMTSRSAVSLSTPDLVNGKPVSEDRRYELLALARASRIQWVLETLSASTDSTSTEKNILSVLTKTEPGQNAIPISDSIQSIFNYFTDIIDDQEFINLQTMIPIACYDEFEYENEKENEIPTSYDPSLDPYSIFVDKLRRPLAIDIVKQLQLYVIKCKSTPVLTTLSAHPHLSAQALQTFVASIAQQCRANPLWSAESSVEFNHTRESIEKFLHIKVYSLVFGTDTEDASHDSLLSRRIQSLDFLSPEHLDIKSLLLHSVHSMGNSNSRGNGNSNSNSNSNSSGGDGGGENMLSEIGTGAVGTAGGAVHWSVLLQGPMRHLYEMERMQCPNDKMVCIKRWATATMSLLNELKARAPQPKHKQRPGAASISSGGGAPPGADEFLSLLILTLQRGNPAQLYTTQKYLQTYLSPTKLNSEYGYLLAQFVSATHFLEYADASSLTISPEEFQLALDASKLAAEKQEEERLLQQQSRHHGHHHHHQSNKHGRGQRKHGGGENSSTAAIAEDSSSAPFSSSAAATADVQCEWTEDGDIVLSVADLEAIEEGYNMNSRCSSSNSSNNNSSRDDGGGTVSGLWKRYSQQQ